MCPYNRDSMKGQAAGKLTCCKDDFACLVSVFDHLVENYSYKYM